jgi:hypothetical protein
MDNPITPDTTAASTVIASGPQAEVTAPPGTALQIAQMLVAEKIDNAHAGKLSKAGNIPALQIAQALNTLRAAGERQEPDARSPEVKQLDAHFPAAKPEEYLIRYGEPGQEMQMTPELKQFDTTARTWMSSAGLSRELGNSLVNTIAKVTYTTKDMTPDQLESYSYAEFAKLGKAFGPTLEEKLQAAA